MTINITCDGKQYRVIKKECAYILSVSIQNSSGEAVLDLDALNFSEDFIRYQENLPNGMSIELVLVKGDEAILKKYKGLTTLDASFNGVKVTATL